MSASQRRKGEEEWRPVVTCGGVFAERYEISSHGRVRASLTVQVKGSKPGRLLFIAKDNKGYPQVILHGRNKRATTIKVHRIVAEAFLSPRPPNATVNHINGDKTDNHVENLEWLSNRENTHHALIHLRGKGIEIFGETLPLVVAVEKFGGPNVTEKCARRRMRRLGWSAVDAVTIPRQPTGRPKSGVVQARAQQQATRCEL